MRLNHSLTVVAKRPQKQVFNVQILNIKSANGVMISETGFIIFEIRFFFKERIQFLGSTGKFLPQALI